MRPGRTSFRLSWPNAFGKFSLTPTAERRITLTAPVRRSGPLPVWYTHGVSPSQRSCPMFERMSNGFSLAGSTWRVLTKDKHLIAFPIVSGFLFLLVVVSFAVPLATLVDWNQVQ